MALNELNQNLPYSDSSWSGITRSGAGKFPNPFFDIASEYVPRDLNKIFEWAEYLYLTFGTYRQAARKVVRYFLTEIVLDGESDKERDAFEDFLKNELHLLTQLAYIGDDFMVYGNCFISMYFPFDRYLICPQCRMFHHIKTLPYKFSLGNLAFSATCTKCGYAGKFKREDRRSMDRKRVKLIRWNPKRIKLRVHEISGDIEYYLELDPRFISKLEDGNRFYLNQTPWPIVQAASKHGAAGSIPYFQFNPDSIYHMKEGTLAGLPILGWGIPPILPNFKLAYYIQILRRYDEAIALDFIVPFRVLYPDIASPAGMGTDPLQQLSMGMFNSHMQQMVTNKRKNITDIQTAPFKVGYEMIGGEAQTLAPKESIAQAMDELLNATGFPAELYRGSLSIQAFPVALRLFEKTWGTLVDGYNDLIAWIVTRIAKYYGWGEIKGALRSVTLADDLERKALQLQASAGMDISKSTAYRPLGIDFMEEQRRVVDEQQQIMELQQEAMEQQQAQQMAGGPPPPGQQGPGGPVGATPGDINQQAKDLAYQLVTQTPESLRRGELIKIKQSNPTLHALVLKNMDDLRAEMSRQGQAMVLQQAQQSKQASAMSSGLLQKLGADKMASPMALGLLINLQVMEYNRKDLRKIAMDIKHEVDGAKDAFHFVCGKIKGWN